MTWMIYGANGYTGALLAERAASTGERPLLAGRNAKAVRSVAERLDLPFVAVDLADDAGLDAALADIDIVAHCAGPFSATASPMAHACLRTGTDYVDVTGEVDVFEALYGLHDDAAAAGVMLVPGVGFDVVPTEYLAVRLARELPTATDLDIALVSRGGFSRGTLRTALEGAQSGGRVRANGELVSVATAHRSRRIRLSGGEVTVHSIPLGDISSAYRSTGIPNITDFTRIPFGGFLRHADPVLRGALRLPGVAKLLDRGIAAAVTGPSENTRADTRSELWAEVSDPSGQARQLRLAVANTYDFTAASALHAVRTLLASESRPGGAYTPTQALGAGFLEGIPEAGVSVGEVTDPHGASPETPSGRDHR
ncbi:saccharopine dehydrogenase NADP-binding domain-containing protein [Nocardia sp. NPDC005366]|uniref:saccharopine dehydrogenase family protein n=1 Tax=Nocardia sp. NPDC005366 TaxID=3156878 RepID=UPI0033AE1DEF